MTDTPKWKWMEGEIEPTAENIDMLKDQLHERALQSLADAGQAADRIDALQAKLDAAEAKLDKALQALDEAVYLLHVNDDDMEQRAGVYRIVTTLREMKGGDA